MRPSEQRSGDVNMRIKLALSTITVVSSLIILSCSKEDPNPVTTPQPPPPEVVPSTKGSLHGLWQNILVNDAIPYLVYDSLTSRLAEKRDYGYNFRSELTSASKVDSNRIWWYVGGGLYDPWYWLKWSRGRDTLTLSYDSLFFSPMRFVRDSIPAHVANWIENITPVEISFYPNITSWVEALAYSDSNWFVLTGTGNNDGVVHKVRIAGTTLASYQFPSARAMDVAEGFLWLAGKFYIEKRNLSDTSLVARFDLSQYFGNNDWIQAMCVSDSTIYLMGSYEKLLVLSTNGTLREQRSTYIGLGDMMLVNGRLWGVYSSNTIHEISPTSLYATHSYYLGGNAVASSFFAIAFRDGKIACADFMLHSLRIFEVAIP